MVEKKYNLDIFKVLDKLSQKDAKYFDELSDEDLKSLHPLVLMRWMSGTTEARQVYFLNELVNTMVFPLAKHKQLLLKLLTICGPGKSRRYNWNKAKGKLTSSTPKCLELVKAQYGLNSARGLDALKVLSNEAIQAIAEHRGLQVDEVREINKELKGRVETLVKY